MFIKTDVLGGPQWSTGGELTQTCAGSGLFATCALLFFSVQFVDLVFLSSRATNLTIFVNCAFLKYHFITIILFIPTLPKCKKAGSAHALQTKNGTIYVKTFESYRITEIRSRERQTDRQTDRCDRKHYHATSRVATNITVTICRIQSSITRPSVTVVVFSRHYCRLLCANVTETVFVRRFSCFMLSCITQCNAVSHRRRSDWNSGGRMAGLTIKVLL